MLSLDKLRGNRDKNISTKSTVASNREIEDEMIICGVKEAIRDGDNINLFLSGDIDATTAPSVTEKVKEMFKEKVPKMLIFDLSEVRYLSSAGLRSFAEIQNLCNKSSVKFVSINLTKQIYQLFNMTGF